MSIKCSIDKEKGIRFHVCRGTVDCDDIACARKGPRGSAQGRIALVVNRDLEYGLARMYEMLSEPELPPTAHGV
jgi:hypothetical protein